MDTRELESADRHLAITAEALFLINLLLLPGVGFAMLVALHFGSRGGNCPLSRNHLSQTMGISVIGAAFIVLAVTLFLLVGELGHHTWIAIVLYLTCIHSVLIVLGVRGLIRALQGKHFVYPVFGRFFCP